MKPEANPATSATFPVVGIVIIGRNEGEDLLRCLSSALGEAPRVVFVDSGSTDDSVRAVRELGVEVVELDSTTPFTAARARNAGFERLLVVEPKVEFVQFVDGDCELQGGWLAAGSSVLAREPEAAAVCGRRRERQPDSSPYNLLTDLEWDEPVSSEATSFGGDVLIRVRLLKEVGGYNPQLIAGEDPELSLRIRQSGHRIVRLGRGMTLHDAKLLHFGPWWRRQVRSGHAYAEVVFLQGAQLRPYWGRTLASIVFWAGLLPSVSLLAAWPTRGWSLALILAEGLLWERIRRHARRDRDMAPATARVFATGCVVGKFAQLRGALEFVWRRWVAGQPAPLIEYKRQEAGDSHTSPDAPRGTDAPAD